MTTVRRQRKGKATRAAILEAATDVLLEDGYGNFVFRGVAKRAGVEPGNVQYYFPTKRDLLSAVLQPELDNYLFRLQAELDKGQTEAEKIDRMVRYLMTDILNERTLKLWLSIYGMATHDDEMAEMVSDRYRFYIDLLAGYLQVVFPDLDNDRAYDAATCITAQFDGLMIVLQIGKPKRTAIARIKRNIDVIVTQIITAETGRL
jgi:AcrR family transcriptional regulator